MEGINTGNHVNHQASDATLQMSRFSGGENANYRWVAPAVQIDQPTGCRNQSVPHGLPQDPKRLKRVNASREYSQRYRLKQLQYIAQLEAGVRALQAEVAITIPRIKYADTQNSLLRVENNSIKQKLANSTGQLMFKQAEYHELKKERDALKQMSLMYHHSSSATKNYVVHNLAMDHHHQARFNQFIGDAGTSNMRPNQNSASGNHQFGFMPPADQNSFVPSGRTPKPNNEENNGHNQM